MERLIREREAHAARDSGSSQKKILAVVLALGVLLVGYLAFAPGSTDAPELSETVPPPTRTATPDVSRDSEVTQTVSQTPALTSAADQGKTITNSIGMEFMLIPAGEFEMGSPSGETDRQGDEGPVHHVNIEQAFYMKIRGHTEAVARSHGQQPIAFQGRRLTC